MDMTVTRRVRWLAPLALAGAAVALAPAGAAGDSVTLKAPVRVTTEGTTACPAEGEPEVTVTSAGTWVGYNDDHECALDPRLKRIVSVQLLPAGGGAARRVPLDGKAGTLFANELLAGDPELMPDPRGGGGVVFTTLVVGSTGTTVEMFRISPKLAVTRLPSPSAGASGGSDDKEFAASDTGARSRYRGRLYVVWDDFDKIRTVFRAFDGKKWIAPVYLQPDIGKSDVAVAPNGDVAVSYETGDGIAVRVSRNGGRSFGGATVALRGTDPGRADPSCPLRPTVGTRQRAGKSGRVAYDSRGHLHVVASFKAPADVGVGAGTGGTGAIWHAEYDGRRWGEGYQVTPENTAVQWAPAIARTPKGGVAVAWLQTADAAMATYDAYLAVLKGGARSFARPVKISPAAATFASAMEAEGNSNCYGIGDYIGLAPSPKGVVAVWPTTEGTLPGVDSDVYAREAIIK
jgi:hypothetical protein